MTAPPLQLEFERGKGFLRLDGYPLGPGVELRRFACEIPDLAFPFDLAGGSDRFRDTRCHLRELALALDLDRIAGSLERASFGLRDIVVRPRDGQLEVAGRVALGGEEGTVWLRLAPIVYRSREESSSERCLALVPTASAAFGPIAVPTRAIATALAVHTASSIGPTEGALARARVEGDRLVVPLVARVARDLLLGAGWKIPYDPGLQVAALSRDDSSVVIELSTEFEHASRSEATDRAILEARTNLRLAQEVVDADALAASGELPSAARAYDRAVRRHGRHPLLERRLIETWIAAGDTASLSRAELRLRGRLDEASDDRVALELSARVRALRGDADGASALLDEYGERHGDALGPLHRDALLAGRLLADLGVEGRSREGSTPPLGDDDGNELRLGARLAVAKRSGDSEEILSCTRKLAFATEDPRRRLALLVELIEASREHGDDPDAPRQLLAVARDLAPTDARVLRLQALAHEDDDRPAQAADAWLDVADAARDNDAELAATALAEAGRIFADALGDVETGLFYAQRALEADASAERPLAILEALAERADRPGLVFAARARAKDGMSSTDAAHSAHPDAHETFPTLPEQGHPHAAVSEPAAPTQARPSNDGRGTAEALVDQASEILDLGGETERAIELLEKARSLDPDGVGARFDTLSLLEEAYDRTGDAEGLLAVYERRISDATEDELRVALSLLAASTALEKLDQPGRALRFLDQARSVDPTNVSAARQRAEVLLALDRPQQAVATLRSVASSDGIDPYERQEVWRELAGLEEASGALEEAAAHHERLLEEIPGDTRSLEALRRIRRQQGRWREVERLALRELALLAGRREPFAAFEELEAALDELAEPLHETAARILRELDEVTDGDGGDGVSLSRLRVLHRLRPDDPEAIERWFSAAEEAGDNAQAALALRALAPMLLSDAERRDALDHAERLEESEIPRSLPTSDARPTSVGDERAGVEWDEVARKDAERVPETVVGITAALHGRPSSTHRRRLLVAKARLLLDDPDTPTARAKHALTGALILDDEAPDTLVELARAALRDGNMPEARAYADRAAESLAAREDVEEHDARRLAATIESIRHADPSSQPTTRPLD